jgi:hypothetical protein
MTLYVITPPGQEKLASVSKLDAGFVSPTTKVEIIDVDESALGQLKALCKLNLQVGDVICQAGLCIRRTVLEIAELAKSTGQNYMPGTGIDHRGVPIDPGKIQHRLPIEKNNQEAWPYVMVIGNPESAKISFELFESMDPDDYWHSYTPEIPTLNHILGTVSVTGFWETPDWFKVVDLSIRDLEIAPVMYASHMWHDWIAFYPANGNFKLENHSQLHPVWMASSEKPLEHWARG